MRTTCSTAVTKILPSPILPVRAALTIASIARSTSVVAHDELDLDLGQEVDDVLGAAIQLGVALLAAEALDLGHRQARDADLGQRLAHFVELERLDDRFDLLHGSRSEMQKLVNRRDRTRRRSDSLHDARQRLKGRAGFAIQTRSFQSDQAEVIG